jgi:hypothetical protein
MRLARLKLELRLAACRLQLRVERMRGIRPKLAD